MLRSRWPRSSPSSCSPPLIYLLLANKVLEGSDVIGKPQALLGAEAEKAARRERVLEQPDRAILQVAIEIDHDVAARDQMHLGKHRIRDQTVIGEDDALAQALV